MAAENGWSREKRLTMRHNIRIPVKYRVWKSDLSEQVGESLDISEGGICFVTRGMLEENQVLEVRFVMPEEVVDEPTAEWRCTGRIVKVDSAEGTQALFKVRVRFECYEVERPNGTTTFRLDLNNFRLGLT